MTAAGWQTVGAVSLGAILGALLRFWAGRWLNVSAVSPLGTFLVNIVGAFLLGLVMGYFTKKPYSPSYYGLAAGFCGSLTTFSSLIFELHEMLQLGAITRAGLYILASLILGLGAFVLGNLAAAWVR